LAAVQQSGFAALGVGVVVRDAGNSPRSGVDPRQVPAADFWVPARRDAAGPAPAAVVPIGYAPHRGPVPVSGARPDVADPRLAAADCRHYACGRSETVEAETDLGY